jgi:hypothetical protein
MDFGQRIDLPRLGRLGDRHRTGLGEMDVRPAGGERADGVGGQLAVLGLRDQQLGSVGEEFGRAALVGLDMRGGRTDDAVIALAERGQRQRIGRRAVEGEKDLAFGLEQRAEGVGGAVGIGVLAISRDIAPVRLGHGGPGLGTDSGIIVAGKLLGHGRFHHKSFLPMASQDEESGGSSRCCRFGHIPLHLERHHLAGGQVGAGRRPGS